ncbi:MAG TPA: AraC family transcriptional regulator [Tepidisphaeraceae bacterium]
MAKPAFANETESVSSFLKTAKGEVLPYRQLFEMLRPALPFAEAVVVSSLPRGGLHIVQPARLPEDLIKTYGRELHTHDRLTWQAIARGRGVRAEDAFGGEDFSSSPFRRTFMEPNGFAHAAAAPLTAPVLDGYPGALHLYREAAQGPFTDEELEYLTEFAHELNDAILRTRHSRHDHSSQSPYVAHSSPVRQFIYDSSLQPVLPQADASVLPDERLRENILQDARKRLDHVNGESLSADRVPLPDSRGDLWNFRVVTHASYPALAQQGPVVFFCLAPATCDWSMLRPADFQADNEIARLIPALRFMREQFHRGPTLVEIAKTVHLSPFHFHRRFTELLGITPKHFLLDCQIMQSKKDLLAGTKDLVTIAKECGFAHQSHFTSRFKQATGLTPTRWRKMAMESQKSPRSN